MRINLAEFVKLKFKTSNIALGQLNEQFIRNFYDYTVIEKDYSVDTVRHHLALIKKACKIAFCDNLIEFLKTMERDDIFFTELTHEFGESYELFLKRDHNHKSIYINHCLTWLNRLIYIAVDKDVLRCNPLEDVAYEKNERPKVPHLTRGSCSALWIHNRHNNVKN